MSRFLRFAIEETLAGRVSSLKESTIGVAVFDRPPDFDPRTDPIVRVEARRLRDKLAGYYRTEGAADPLVIELPKGGYAPRIRQLGTLPPAVAASTGIRLAVLPFTNLSSNAGEGDYFSEGLAEELIHVLTRIPGLEVIAWSSSARLHNEGDELNRLDLNYYLRGSVRKTAGQVRVSIQLIEAQGRRYVWSEVYEQALGDLLAIETEIAREIATRLRIGFTCRTGMAPFAAASRPAHGSEEHTLYLMGRFHTNRRTIEGLEKSVRCYEQAIVLRPDYALAHAGLADSFSLLTTYGALAPSVTVPLARAAALRALDLDPVEAGAAANASLALITGMHDWDWVAGEALYRKSIEQDPNYAMGRHWFAIDHLAALGRYDEAEHHLRIACRLDPLSAVIQDAPGYILMLQRRYDEALRSFQRIAELDPLFYVAHTSIGRIYSLMGRHEEALAAYRKGRKLAGEAAHKVDGAMAQTLALLGRTVEAREILDRMLERSKTAFVPSTAIAIAYLGLGERAKALDYLEIAVGAHEFSIALAQVHPVYDPLRDEPRFPALLRRMRFLP